MRMLNLNLKLKKKYKTSYLQLKTACPKNNMFFVEIREGNKIQIPEVVMERNDYRGEPILVSIQEKWNLVSFDMLYEGAEKEDWELPQEIATTVGFSSITKNGVIILSERCMEVLRAWVGDVICLTVLPRGFFMQKHNFMRKRRKVLTSEHEG